MKFSNSNYAKSTDVEKAKIIFQFSLMLVASVIGGICFSRFVGENAINGMAARLYGHFFQALPAENLLSNFFIRLLRTVLCDILCISIIFVFSFSFINYIVTDAVLIFTGFKFGMNAAVIKLATSDTLGVGNMLTYLLIRGVLLPIFLVFTCRMAIYSLKLRRFSGDNGRIALNTKSLFLMLRETLTMLLAVMVFNIFYCVFVYIF